MFDILKQPLGENPACLDLHDDVGNHVERADAGHEEMQPRRVAVVVADQVGGRDVPVFLTELAERSRAKAVEEFGEIQAIADRIGTSSTSVRRLLARAVVKLGSDLGGAE